MAADHEFPPITFEEPLKVASASFHARKWEHYRWMLEERPFCRVKFSVMEVLYVARYQDCVDVSKDPRFVRNRQNAGAKRKLPVPIPKSIAPMVESMIYEDGDAHRRLRNLVNRGFRPHAVEKLGDRIEELTHQLLDAVEQTGQMDLLSAYAQPIPSTIIGEVVGVQKQEMQHFQSAVRVLTDGFSGWSLARTLLWDMRRSARFIREVISKKRMKPADDIMTNLLSEGDDGDRLSDDEMLSMVFLLIVAGHETTLHLINNGVLTLFQHPQQLERLRAEPALIDSAVEEMLRFCSPVHGSKPAVAVEDVLWNGFKIEKGTNLIPNWASANRDPRVFPNPDVFDIGRSPNHHVAFAHGAHFCLGAQLARLETKIAIRTLLERFPNLRLGIEPDEVDLEKTPFWHRHRGYPVILS
ncbi:cytochrome P450 [Myxococcota bacterium]|nr:cytochrome P450 [Myxococcota bacterium]